MGPEAIPGGSSVDNPLVSTESFPTAGTAGAWGSGSPVPDPAAIAAQESAEMDRRFPTVTPQPRTYPDYFREK